MTDEPRDVRTLAVVLLATAMGLLFLAPAASAQEASCTDVLENRSGVGDAASPPGGLLADAIGDHRDEIGGGTDDPPLDARLRNATSARERARLVADEVELIEANLSTVERCWGINRSESDANRTLAELDDDERTVLENHTRSLHERLNASRTAAEELPRALRHEHDVDNETMASIERRVVAARNATAREEPTTNRPFPFP